jgi:hypothetical protein
VRERYGSDGVRPPDVGEPPPGATRFGRGTGCPARLPRRGPVDRAVRARACVIQPPAPRGLDDAARGRGDPRAAQPAWRGLRGEARV